MSYAETIEYLYGLQKFGIKLGLENMERLMDILGRPERDYKKIHVAGTNGKGSTSAIIASLLRSSGLKTGLYTSPHMVRFTERIRINSEEIDENEVVEITGFIRERLPEGLRPTFFEFVTALAFRYFSLKKVDAAVIEVGMGGRLDATNVIRPEISVITRLGMDHREFLGDTLQEIAFEKAGIIKEGIPVVVAKQEDVAIEVIKQKALKTGSPLYLYQKDFRGILKEISPRGIIFDYYDEDGSTATSPLILHDLFLPLTGEHQLENACIAIKAFLLFWWRSNSQKSGFGDKIKTEEAIKKVISQGLRSVRWPGRLELIVKDGIHYLFDGAHNPQAASQLSRALKDIYLKSYRRIILVLGIMADKEANGIIEPLSQVSEVIIATQPEYKRALNSGALEALIIEITKRSKEIYRCPSVSEAITKAEELYREGDLIVITGSFYLLGEAKVFLGEPERLRKLSERI